MKAKYKKGDKFATPQGVIEIIDILYADGMVPDYKFNLLVGGNFDNKFTMNIIAVHEAIEKDKMWNPIK